MPFTNIYIINVLLFVFSVNIRDASKVGMEDFELLKVLGTGGMYTIFICICVCVCLKNSLH